MKRTGAVVLVVALGALAISSASANAETYWKSIYGSLQVKPKELQVSHGTSSSTLRFEGLEWRGWGSSRAEGKGTVLYKTCDPNCFDPSNVATYEAKIWLSKINSACGQPRYMRVRVAYRRKGRWQAETYDDVSCKGNMVNPGGRPYPSTPKPRLKRVTAKAYFRKASMTRDRPRYLGCSRVTRLRFRCRAKWVYHGVPEWPTKDIYRLRGSVRKWSDLLTVKVNVVLISYSSTGKSRQTRTYSKTYWVG
jgi:hypothetical protein